jgi:predicted enzyme related to lactoylglutathione lyase
VIKLDHLSLQVSDYARSRDWYKENLGLQVEFEVREAKFVALKDDADFGFLLAQGETAEGEPRFQIYFQVDDVDKLHARLSARGVKFDHPPEHKNWGYGPQLKDPDGYILRFYDHRSITPPPKSK